MKVDVIVVYVQRYRKGHELDFVPPLTASIWQRSRHHGTACG